MIERTTPETQYISIEQEAETLTRIIQEMGRLAVRVRSEPGVLTQLQSLGAQMLRLSARLELQLEHVEPVAAETIDVPVGLSEPPESATQKSTAVEAPAADAEPADTETKPLAAQIPAPVEVARPDIDARGPFPKPESLPRVTPKPDEHIVKVVIMRDDLILVDGTQMPVNDSKRFALIKLMVNRDQLRSSRELQEGLGGDVHTEAQRFSALISALRRQWRGLTGAELTTSGLRYQLNVNIDFIDKREEIARLPNERLRARAGGSISPSQSLARLGLHSLAANQGSPQTAGTSPGVTAGSNGKSAGAVKALPTVPSGGTLRPTDSLRAEKIGSSPLGDWNSAATIAEHINFLQPNEYPVSALVVEGIIYEEMTIEPEHVRNIDGKPEYSRQQSFTIARTVRRILNAQ